MQIRVNSAQRLRGYLVTTASVAGLPERRAMRICSCATAPKTRRTKALCSLVERTLCHSGSAMKETASIVISIRHHPRQLSQDSKNVHLRVADLLIFTRS